MAEGLTLEKLRKAKEILDRQPVISAPRFLAVDIGDGNVVILREDGSIVFDEEGNRLVVDRKVLEG